MNSRSGLTHVVVDGSNIATEGRSTPSLKQLNEAVMSFLDEHPDAAMTVVVDATFGHRIDKSEADEFEEGISNNELVAPPAGAVGRGDAFVLGIADKAGATVLSNDSFQEFHGEYPWLFDEGRLVGGKPVPHVGWVWVDRVPVRGPVSRKATKKSSARRSSKKTASRQTRSVRQGSAEANQPMPVPTEPPPGRSSTETPSTDTPSKPPKKSSRRSAKKPAGTVDKTEAATTSSGSDRERRRPPAGGETVNDLLPFLEFVEHHPIGTRVSGVVDSYSSHGAYIAIGDDGIRGYVPLRLMADPAPRSAKKILTSGETVEVVVVSFAAERRSIDCALPAMADAALAARESDDDGSADQPVDTGTTPGGEEDAAPARSSRRGGARKPAPKKAAAKRPATKKTAAKKTASKKTAAAKTPAKKTSARKTPARKTASKKTAAAKTPAKKTASKKTVATKTPAKKAATKKAATKKAATKKAATKKTATKKTATKKTAARKRAAASGSRSTRGPAGAEGS